MVPNWMCVDIFSSIFDVCCFFFAYHAITSMSSDHFFFHHEVHLTTESRA